MARLSNASGANSNGAPSWHDKRRRDSYGDNAPNSDTHDDEDDE